MKIEPTPIYYKALVTIEHLLHPTIKVFKQGNIYKQLGIAEEPIMLCTEQGQPKNCDSLKQYFKKVKHNN